MDRVTTPNKPVSRAQVNPKAPATPGRIGLTGQIVSENVRKLRQAAGLTQQQLGELVREQGIAGAAKNGWVSNTEVGVRSITVDDLAALCLVFGRPPSELLGEATRTWTEPAEVEALRAELWAEWLSNHDEHCTNEWPHKASPGTGDSGCYLPLPTLLWEYKPSSDEMPYFPRIEHAHGLTAREMWDRYQLSDQCTGSAK